MEQADRARRPPPYGDALVLGAVHAAAFADRFLPALLASYLVTDLHLGDATLGLLQGPVFVLPYALATLLFGRLADGRSPRAVILAGLLIWTAATLACAFVTASGQLVALRAGLGIGEAALTPAALRLLGRRRGDGAARAAQGLGRAVGLFTSGALLGKSVALGLGGALLLALTRRTWLVGVAPWRLVFVIFGLANLVLAFALLRLDGGTVAPRRRRSGVGAELRARWRTYLAMSGPLCAGVLISQTLAAWAPLVLTRDFGLKPASAGLLMGALVLVFGPSGGLTGGLLADRRPFATTGAFAGLLCLAILGLLAPLLLHLVWLEALGLALALFAVGALASLGLTRLQTLAPGELRGAITSLHVAVATLIAFGLGPSLVGLAADRLAGREHPTLLALALVTSVGGAIGAAATLAMRRPQPPPT